MEPWMTEFGIGGILAILILREVFNFLKPMLAKIKDKNKCNPTSLPDGITRAEFEAHKSAVQYEGQCKQIVKRIDGRFDTAEERAKERHGEVLTLIGNLK